MGWNPINRTGDRAGRVAPLGVDIGPDRVVAAQVALREGRPELVAAASAEAGSGQAEALERVLCAVERQGGNVRQAIVAAPSDEVVSLALELPPKESGAPISKIAAGELARAHGCDEGAISTVLRETGKGKNGQTLALGLGLTVDVGEAIIASTERHGICVEQLLPVQASLEAVCGTLGHECVMVVNLDPMATGSVICVDGSLVLERQFSSGASGEVEALSNEIESTLGFLQHMRPGIELTKLLLVGAGATRRGLAAGVAEELEVDTDVLVPSAFVASNANFVGACADPAFVPAIGLSMCGLPREDAS